MTKPTKEEEREMRELAEEIAVEHEEEVRELIDKLLGTKSDSWWKAMVLENVKKELLREQTAAV